MIRHYPYHHRPWIRQHYPLQLGTLATSCGRQQSSLNRHPERGLLSPALPLHDSPLLRTLPDHFLPDHDRPSAVRALDRGWMTRAVRAAPQHWNKRPAIMTVVTDYILEDASLGGCGGLGCCGPHCHDMSQQPSQCQHDQPHEPQPAQDQQQHNTSKHHYTADGGSRQKTPLHLESSCSPCSSNPASPTHEYPQQSLVGPKSRRTLKNEDSSYDSDFESSEVLGPTSSASWQDEEQHDDVCRTVSDTLAAEFAEYVTIQPNTSTTPVLPTATTKTIVTSEHVVTTAISSSSAITSTSLVTPSSSSTTTSSSLSSTTTALTAATSSTSCVSLGQSTSSLTVTCAVSDASKAVTTLTISNNDNKLANIVSCSTSSSTSSNDATVATTCVDHHPKLAAVSSIDTVTVTSIVGRVACSSITTPSTGAQGGVLSKTPLAAAASLPNRSHAALTSKSSTPVLGSASGRSLVLSTAGTRPSSAPVTQTLSSTLPTTSSGESRCTGQNWTSGGTSLYHQQVEFGIKLGYSESLVQLALEKLGYKPAKNELLDELIRLGAGAPKPEGELEVSLLPSAEGDDARDGDPSSYLRPIIIDGSNVAMCHGNKHVFSCLGIRVCVDWFRSRGHREILVFVPSWRKESSRPDAIITDQEVLTDLEQQKVLVFTPSRSGHTSGRRIVPYDDRYILNEAARSGGVVVSNDHFRDLVAESAGFKRVVEEALLMYSWVNGRFVPPDDPLGRNGPTLDAFLRRPTQGIFPGTSQARDLRPCPYGRKCTYGNKCKYQHPERGTQPVKSVTERLQEHREKHLMDKAAKSRDSSPGENLRGNFSVAGGASCATTAAGAAASGAPANGKRPLSRLHSSSSSNQSALSLLPEAPPSRDSSTSNSQPRYTTAHISSRQDPTPHECLASTVSSGLPPHSPLHGTTTPSAAAAAVDTHQHLMLSAQPSFDHQQQHSSYDAYRNPLFKSESCLYPLFTTHEQYLQQQQQQSMQSQIPLQQQQPPPSIPPQHIQQHMQQQNYQQQQPPPNWSFAQQQQLQDSQNHANYPEHMMVNKQLSDPDKVTSDNPHPKLRRQLTLNPCDDQRLAKMIKTATHQKSLPMLRQMAGYQAGPSQYHQSQQLHMSNLCHMAQSQQQVMQPSQQYPGALGSLQSYASYRNSEQLSHQAQQQQQQAGASQAQEGALYHTSYSHPHVTRFSSAPDPIWGGSSAASQYQANQGPPTITRLNSTSDPYLNLYGSADSPQYLSEPYEEQQQQQQQQQCLSQYSGSLHGISGSPSSSSPGPVGSRPMSPLHQTLLQHTRGQQLAQSSLSLTNTSFPPPKSTGKEEERSKLYYHLSNLFAEDKVLAALSKHPNETDPIKLCSFIISSTVGSSSTRNPFSASNYEEQQCRAQYSASPHGLPVSAGSGSPGPVGSRPMSPHQQTLLHHARSQHLAQSSLSLPGTSFPQKSSGKEEERSKFFFHFSNLFPEDKVLAALAKHPNEVDPCIICASIITLSTIGTSAGRSSFSATSQMQQPSHQQLMSCQSVPLPIRVPSPTNPAPFSGAMGGGMPHEDSRLRDYLNAPAHQAETPLRNLASSLSSGTVHPMPPHMAAMQQPLPPLPGQQQQESSQYQSRDAT